MDFLQKHEVDPLFDECWLFFARYVCYTDWWPLAFPTKRRVCFSSNSSSISPFHIDCCLPPRTHSLESRDHYHKSSKNSAQPRNGERNVYILTAAHKFAAIISSLLALFIITLEQHFLQLRQSPISMGKQRKCLCIKMIINLSTLRKLGLWSECL